MADILTHYTVGKIASIRLNTKDETALLIGSILPDAISKSMLFIFESRYAFTAVSDSLIGALMYTLLMACLFVHESIRWRFWKFLFIGYCTHLVVDMFKDYLGHGAVFPLLPLSLEPLEVAFYCPFDSVYLLPVNVIILLAIYKFKQLRAVNNAE